MNQAYGIDVHGRYKVKHLLLVSFSVQSGCSETPIAVDDCQLEEISILSETSLTFCGRMDDI